MEAKELRIGNFIALQEKPITVNLTTIERIFTKNPKYYGSYNPIPVTEEWFTMFDYENSVIALYDFESLSESHLGFRISIHPDDFHDMWSKMAVHEFQNWWKSCTGKELTLKA